MMKRIENRIPVFLKLGIRTKRWQMSGRINKAIVI